MIDLFLVRHTKAVDGGLYADDAARPLAADGRRAALDVGAALARHGVRLDTMVASPLVRAVETAELLAVQIAFAGGLTIHSGLVPEASAGDMRDELLARLDDGARVALVGHQPSMGYLLSSLLGRTGLGLSKGAVVRLAWDGRGAAQLVWVITPRQLDPVASLDVL